MKINGVLVSNKDCKALIITAWDCCFYEFLIFAVLIKVFGYYCEESIKTF